MTYMALYREWRPRNFSQVVGQEHVVRTLVNALKSERVAHAYLFAGPRGTGKTSIAKIMARAVNCARPQGADPCGGCDSCREIEAGTSMDVTEIDAASNRGIDEVRDLREKVKFAPSSGKYRVFIIDEVHMLTNEAFNALLKTLEEPPSHVIFMLATTEPHRVPLTILSRCQRFDFRRIGDRQLTERLAEVAEGAGIAIDREAMELIVRAAEGAVRDALSILDQAAAYSGSRIGADDIHSVLGTVREDLLGRAARGLMSGRAGDLLALVGEISDQGKDLRVFIKELNAYLRGLLLEKAKSAGPGEDEAGRLAGVLHSLVRIEQDMRWSTQPRVLLEVALVRAARMLPGENAGGNNIGDLAARVKDLEGMVARLAGGISPGTGSPPAAREEVEPRKMQDSSGEKKDPPAYNKEMKHSGPARVGEASAEEASKEEKIPAPEPELKKADVSGNIPGDLILKRIESRWSDIMDVAGKVRPNIASHLAQGKAWPLEVEGGTLTIAFPRAESYTALAVGILDSEANRRELADLIKSVCQVDLRLRLTASDRKPPRKMKQQKRVVQPEDVKALFGGDEDLPADGFEGFDS